MKNGSSVGIYTHFIHVFARLAPICMLSRCLSTKFLHRNSCRKFIKSALVVGWVTTIQMTHVRYLLHYDDGDLSSDFVESTTVTKNLNMTNDPPLLIHCQRWKKNTE